MGLVGSAAAIDAGLRNYMIRIYTYMAGGLTAIAAYVAASSGFYQSIVVRHGFGLSC